MIDNINPQKNPITTILGLILVVVCVCMFVAPMFVSVHEDYSSKLYVPIGIGIVGLLLIGSPDKLFSALGKAADKKSDQV